MLTIISYIGVLVGVGTAAVCYLAAVKVKFILFNLIKIDFKLKIKSTVR
jgi:hypothetical protein